jgi:hypothetical protein
MPQAARENRSAALSAQTAIRTSAVWSSHFSQGGFFPFSAERSAGPLTLRETPENRLCGGHGGTRAPASIDFLTAFECTPPERERPHDC